MLPEYTTYPKKHVKNALGLTPPPPPPLWQIVDRQGNRFIHRSVELFLSIAQTVLVFFAKSLPT